MAKWTLTRQLFGTEEYTLSDGDKVTIGRGAGNNITLSSAVVSRNHCIIQVQTDNALITDLQSSNGVWVGTKKIPPNEPYVIGDSDVIGFGWAEGTPLVEIDNNEKYMFMLKKEKLNCPLPSRIQYQSDDEIDDINAEIEKLNGDTKSKSQCKRENTPSPKFTNLSLKRKLNNNIIHKQEKPDEDNSVVYISDTDNNLDCKPAETGHKKAKLVSINGNVEKEQTKENEIKNENEFVEYDAFSVKQEFLGYDDEPINIDDESDSESEQWFLRLSQNSPGKPLTKIAKIKPDIKADDSSYSQIDDDFISRLVFEEEEEVFEDDIICLPQREEQTDVTDTTTLPDKTPNHNEEAHDAQKPIDNGIEIDKSTSIVELHNQHFVADKINRDNDSDRLKQVEVRKSPQNELCKKVQMIEPQVHLPKGRSNRLTIVRQESKIKNISKHRDSKVKSHSKIHIPPAQIEERKKKLKEIATKDKEIDIRTNTDTINTNKPITNVKITPTNRGAFLSEATVSIAKPAKRKKTANRSKDKTRDPSLKLKETKDTNITENVENSTKDDSEILNKEHNHKLTGNKSVNDVKTSAEKERRVPLKNLKALTCDREPICKKPISKVGPMKIKKKVSFSESPPEVREFIIEPGNKMKKTSSVKTSLVDIQQTPVFSLEKITLMKVLRWNPQWLDEQLMTNDPPPILGHNNTPNTLFHSFVSHHQYIQFVGDLLLMEIWECITIGHTKAANKNYIQMTIESLPPMPTQERYFDLFNLSVSVLLHPSEIKNLPRFGEIMHVLFGPENARFQRFFYVHNVRQFPAPSGQANYFYSISLYATMTDKMTILKQGENIFGRSLAYINKELTLFEAMEYLGGSPLMDAILKPSPSHFINSNLSPAFDIKSQWTKDLNPSQLKAVNNSVTAALCDTPSIQMVQGPPGTGKSSVICAIVMAYFYNSQVQKQQNRGKILICATSNAAVDGLVVRLLEFRQKLPKEERFRMVRVGRQEAMHPVAANISSQQIAQRDLARINDQPPNIEGLNEEILHMEAKINMWKTNLMNAKDKDPVREAYCQSRLSELFKRMSLLRSGSAAGGDELRLPDMERRVIEHADIVVTTLASAHNNKMRGLKRRIALCIIDEAGQVIEPETLIPLTLDVTRLTLIGDPQQLPGFICSQRAKKHGLSESLFSRLSSYTDSWAEHRPLVLLDRQYRMHPEIAEYPSRAFYGGLVRTARPARPAHLPLPPYHILSIYSGDKGQGTSGANEMEAWGVTRLVVAVEAMLRPLKLNLAVITPYNAHKDLIKKHLKTLHNHGESAVEVNTVDSFQGQERDVVVVSLARSHGVGFLTDTGRMNVMLTRAKHALLICLNPHALMKNDQWRTLIEDAQKRKLFTTLPSNMCQPISSEEVPNDYILKYILNNKCGGRSHR